MTHNNQRWTCGQQRPGLFREVGKVEEGLIYDGGTVGEGVPRREAALPGKVLEGRTQPE